LVHEYVSAVLCRDFYGSTRHDEIPGSLNYFPCRIKSGAGELICEGALQIGWRRGWRLPRLDDGDGNDRQEDEDCGQQYPPSA
jgi:hypothetical protein